MLGGLWCAARPRSRAARALESAATFLVCAPVYAVGLGLLLLLQAMSMWAAALIVALSLLGDLAIVRLDPRVRSAGRTVG